MSSVIFIKTDHLSPEVRTVIAAWEAAMAATLEYMGTTPPPVEGFSEDADAIAELPMTCAIAMAVPMIHESDNKRLFKKSWLKRVADRLDENLAAYSASMRAENEQRRPS